MNDFTIDELHIPRTIDAPDAADFIEMAELRNAVEAFAAGNEDFVYEPAELLPVWLNSYEPKRVFVARVDGRIVARVVYELNFGEGSRAAWLTAEVLPEFRERGIGGALYDVVLAIAREAGRDILQSYAFEGDSAFKGDGADRVLSPTGFGSVSRSSPGSRFLRAREYSLEQVERVSRLELPVTPGVLEAQLAHAAEAAGDDYRLVYWSGRTPDERLEEIALMRTRMGTDAPYAGLEPETSVWTAERVRDEDDRLEAGPRTMLTVAVEHVPTGTLAGFSELSVPAQSGRSVEQHDTLVLSEHRGKRLGMLLKAANLIRLQELLPGHPSVITFNAEENRHMLDVNEAVGFVAIGYEGAWKKVVTAK